MREGQGTGDFRRPTVLLILTFLVLSGCSPFSSKKSPLILVMVESFSEKDYLCSESRLFEGLDELNTECENFIRFTHSFAPSPMTQASLATLLTGKGISEHNVKTNGEVGLSSQFQTLGELALNNRMRTGLFSGGVPLMQKSGITQGYEFFNDSFDRKKKSVFRPFHQSIKRSLRWLDEEVVKQPFFLTYYVPDVLYKDYITRSDLDDERPLNRSSQLQEIFESINQLIKQLKKRKLWENSHVVIVGLGGEETTLNPINPLSSDLLHVPLQIKLAGNVDSNLKELTREVISFEELGEWLQKFLQHRPGQGKLLFSPDHSDSFIPQQSHRSQWLGLANWPEIGLRKKQYLFSLTPKLKVYDSFTDRKELEPLSPFEATRLSNKYELSKSLKAYYAGECYRRPEGPVSRPKKCEDYQKNKKRLNSLVTLLNWSEIVWDEEQPTDVMAQLVREALEEESPLVVGWLAYQALYQKKWASLFELGKKVKNKAWMLLAESNMRQNLSQKNQGCLRYFVGENHQIANFYKYCQDTALRKVVEGLKKLKNKQRPSDSFWAQVHQIKNIRRAKNLNLKMLFINDVRDPFDFAPMLAELYFFLPENSRYQSLIQPNET